MMPIPGDGIGEGYEASRVNDLLVKDGNLFIGGDFAKVGVDLPSRKRALWLDGTITPILLRSFVARGQPRFRRRGLPSGANGRGELEHIRTQQTGTVPAHWARRRTGLVRTVLGGRWRERVSRPGHLLAPGGSA